MLRLAQCVIVAFACVVGIGQSHVAAEPQAAGLRIVVIEGEDAVNIIQQKTAVAPVIEVRDRNDQPVAGAVVNFAIRSGRATFSGARTLSVTTNAAGRAVAAGFAPTGSGALQISASAAFQGQTAAVTIAQTNVLTAAQAAAVSSAGSAGGSSGGASAGGSAAAGGGGGGLSATTIGIVGGAIAGGALVAVAAGDEAPVVTSPTTYRGNYSGQQVIGFNNQGVFCTNTTMITGTLVIELQEAGSGVSGTASVDQTQTIISSGTATCLGATLNQPSPFRAGPSAVTGAANNLGFSHQNTFSFTNAGGSGTVTWAQSFAGTLSGGQITGVLTQTQTDSPSGFASGTGTTTFAVTLR